MATKRKTATRKTAKKKTTRKKPGALTSCAKRMGSRGGKKSAAKRKTARRGTRKKKAGSGRKKSLLGQLSLF